MRPKQKRRTQTGAKRKHSSPRPREVWNALRRFRAAHAALGQRLESFDEALRGFRGACRQEVYRELLGKLASSDAGEVLNELARIRNGASDDPEVLGRITRDAAGAVDSLFEVLGEETGLEPVSAIGEVVEICAANSGQYEIPGAALDSIQGQARAVVVAPGWQIGSKILQRPRLRLMEPPTAERPLQVDPASNNPGLKT